MIFIETKYLSSTLVRGRAPSSSVSPPSATLPASTLPPCPRLPNMAHLFIIHSLLVQLYIIHTLLVHLFTIHTRLVHLFNQFAPSGTNFINVPAIGDTSSFAPSCPPPPATRPRVFSREGRPHSAVERTRHIYDNRCHILALAFSSPPPAKVRSPFMRMENGGLGILSPAAHSGRSSSRMAHFYQVVPYSSTGAPSATLPASSSRLPK